IDETMLFETVGATIRKLRKGRKWSQEKLSEYAELGTVQISKIENGRTKPTVITLIKLSAALGVPLTDILPDSLTR
ncbi:helix-turn-helix domain-containing protein, partial [Mailhella sp.]|uniref:helix-turn-helix domain-containing protein n=1 Tax=Mailhella sp. TaxID=1981029 RepID=UPI0040627E22